MSLRIAIFDDNKNIRNSIIMLLSTEPAFKVVGNFSHAHRCVEDIAECLPDIVLMDIEMPGIDGIEAIKRIKSEFPDIQILIQTIFEDDDRIYASILAGASGYILKSDIRASLVEAINELHFGGSPMSPSIARRVLQLLKKKEIEKPCPVVDYHLTSREKELLTYLVNGLSYKMIGAEMNITYETVRSHMKNIYEKLHVASLTEVVAKAIIQNIV